MPHPSQAARQGQGHTSIHTHILMKKNGSDRKLSVSTSVDFYEGEGEWLRLCCSDSSLPVWAPAHCPLPLTHLCGFPLGSAIPSPPSAAGFSASSALLCGSLCKTQRELEERKGMSFFGLGHKERLKAGPEWSPVNMSRKLTSALV